MGQLSPSERASIRVLANDGLNARTIARLLNRHHRAVQRVLDGREYVVRPGPARIKPSREAIERIVGEEAARHGADVLDVLGSSNRPAAKGARTAAVERIMQETGCSHRGLEEVWGASLKRLAERSVKVDAARASTFARLAWAYGPDRAREIAEGRDETTNTDIERWKRLCALGGKP